MYRVLRDITIWSWSILYRNPIYHCRRGLLKLHSHFPEVLLRRQELHPEEWIHVEAMTKSRFIELYGSERPLFMVKDLSFGTCMRMLTVLPLYLDIKEDHLLPLPFVVDTGAPGAIYLGRKMRKLLTEQNLLHDVVSLQGPHRVHGTFVWKDNKLSNPVTNMVPCEHEIEGEDDIRVNILGLDGISQLELLEGVAMRKLATIKRE